MEGYLEQVIVTGLNEILQKEEHEKLKGELFANHFDLVKVRLAEIQSNLQMKILENLISYSPQTLEEDFWVKYISQGLSKFENAPAKYIFDNSALFILLNRIQDNHQKVDWFDILTTLSSSMAEVGKKIVGFTTVLEWLVSSDINNLLKLLHRSETKKYPRDLKMKLYRQLIEAGLLDTKIARRIRSDTSGELSKDVLEIVFENRNAYSEDDFQNLIVQFADTKHQWVARYAALNMPLHLAPYLMGVEDKVALGILEKRLNLED